MKQRKNGWSAIEDETVRDTIIRYAEDGLPQSKAYQQIAAMLPERTPKACKLRWERTLQKQYGEQLVEAVKRGQQRKRREDGWEPYEDNTLASAVLRAVCNEDTLVSAYLTASRRLKRSLVGCKLRWLNVLAPEYRNKIEDIKRQRRIEAEKGTWSAEEDEILMHHIASIEYEGKPLQRAYERTSKETGRSVSACKTHYLEVISPTLREEPVPDYAIDAVVGEWEPQEDGILLVEVRNALADHRSLRSAYQQASRRTGRTVNACQDRWHRELKYRYRDQFEYLQSDTIKRVDGWSEEEELVLVKELLAKIRAGRTQQEAFVEIAKLLHRPPAAISVRWNKELKEKHQEDYAAARSAAESISGAM